MNILAVFGSSNEQSKSKVFM